MVPVSLGAGEVMATRKTKTTSRRRVVDEVREEEEPRDPIADLRAQFGMEGYRLKLERYNETPPKHWEYVAMIEPSEELHEYIMSEYGGGKYRIQVRTASGYQKGGLFSLNIAGLSKSPQDRNGAGGEQLARLEKVVERLAERPATNGDEALTRIVAIITTIATAATPIIAALMNRPATQGADVATTLQLVSDAEARGRRLGEQLGTLTAAAAGGGGGERSDSLGDVAREYLPKIVDLARDNMKRRHNGAAPAPVPPGDTAPVATIPAPALLPDASDLAQEYRWLAQLRPYYGRLLQEAARDRDPALVADVALSEMDVPTLEAVARAAQRPDFTDTLNVELAAIHFRHADWLHDFLERIIENSQPEEPTPPKGRKKP